MVVRCKQEIKKNEFNFCRSGASKIERFAMLLACHLYPIRRRGQGNRIWRSGIVIATGPLPNGNELFFGFSQSTPFSSILLFQTSSDDGIGMDGVYLQSVPEPSGSILVMMVAICLSRIRVNRGLTNGCLTSRVH